MSDTQLFEQNLTGIGNSGNPLPGAWPAVSGVPFINYAAPVFIDGPGTVGNAQAIIAPAAQVVGLSLRECDAVGAGTYVSPLTGPIDFPIDQWDAVTGQTGGLTVGAAYYLSAAVSGRLTTTPPSSPGQFIVYIGIGRDPTTMILNIQTLGAQVPVPAPIIE